MRVIGGRSRGRRLPAKLPASVRPTSDRVREAIFDILGSQGGVEGLTVVDLFCGSGALGVEALSRGAASSTFVDLDPDALAAVRQNLEAVGLDDEPVDAGAGRAAGLARTRRPPARSTSPCAIRPTTSRTGRRCSARCGPTRSSWNRRRPIVLPGAWVVARERRYGGTLVTVAHRSGDGS